MRHRDPEASTSCWENGANRLVGHRGATDLPSVQNEISLKGSETRYACTSKWSHISFLKSFFLVFHSLLVHQARKLWVKQNPTVFSSPHPITKLDDFSFLGEFGTFHLQHFTASHLCPYHLGSYNSILFHCPNVHFQQSHAQLDICMFAKANINLHSRHG